jgi:hypothetical protein
MAGKRTTLAVLVSVAILLAACGPRAEENVVLNGRLIYRSETPVPEDALVRISVREGGPGEIVTRIVTERSLYPGHAKLVRFRLVIPRTLLGSRDEYSLRAEILGAAGETLWATVEAIPLSLSSDIPMLIVHLSNVR